MNNQRLMLLFALLIVFAPSFAPAGTKGKIAGKVVSASTGDPVIGASVMIEGTHYGAATDLDGKYVIIDLPPATYSVRASAVGFTPMVVRNVTVSADLTTNIDFRLTEANIQVKEVVVTAQRPLVQKDLTSSESRIESSTIQKLPVEDVQGIVNLQAGVVNGHFRGGRTGEVAYMVDGILVNDAYSGQPALQVENSAVQEIQVISGTFNAEYGQAMSGVVNVVTKDGGGKFVGQLSSYVGRYWTSHSNIFWNDGNSKLSSIYNLEGVLSGPIPFLEGSTFFVNSRLYNNDGPIYGKRVYNPQDSSNFSYTPWYIQSTGDGKYVPMNPDRRWTLMAKLSLNTFRADRLNLSGLYQWRFFRNYEHNFRLNPDGAYRNYENSFGSNIEYTHVFGKNTFLVTRGSLMDTRSYQYVYSDPFDQRYVNPVRLQQRPIDTFYTGGTEMWHYNHDTRTYIVKVDLISQISKQHLFKTGAELQLYRLWSHDYQVRLDATTGYKPALPPPDATDNIEYSMRPMQLSCYLQDKMEFDHLIVNAGVRYDYFKPAYSVPLNPDALPNSSFVDASPKSQVSPRLGLAYPITDRGVIHLSYGEFFQIPPFQYLYQNPDYKVMVSGQVQTVVGNANLKPQRTAAYEVGLQQQLSEVLAMDLTLYYKDIRNLIDTEIHDYLNGAAQYAMFVNRDYGNVKGIVISFEKRFSNGFSANIDYTFQVARGNASDPLSVYLDNQTNPPRESPKSLVPLDWDRRHSLNLTFTYGKDNDYDISIVGRAGSGLPYTPSQSSYRSAGVNSENKPAFFDVDLYANKYFRIGGQSLSVFVKVYNLLDTLNELNVFTDTGRAGYTTSLIYDPPPPAINTLAEYFTRPDFYSPPRQVIAGITINLGGM
ncbi:MAG: TonB-dependent receptor [Bacteroidota bacterium]